MKPIKIEFQAFGPYVGHEEVDFEDISKKGLFLICGKTGIGKTMILDAMTFALYGKSSGHGRDDFTAMRCTKAEFAVTTFVKFIFENNGEYYLFERRLEPKRKNFTLVYNLMIKENDEWKAKMNNPKEADLNKEAENIIGLDYEQFRQVIVLPQGQFEKFLTSNSNEKEKILTSIFGEDKWQRIAENFYSDAEKRKKDLDDIKDDIKKSLEAEKCESFEELSTLIEHKKEDLKILTDTFQKENYEHRIEELNSLIRISDRFQDLHKAEGKLNELTGIIDERNLWEKTYKNAEKAEKVRKAIEDVHIAEKEYNSRLDEEKDTQKKEEEINKNIENIFKALELHNSEEEENNNRNALRIQYEGKRDAYENLEKAELDLAKKENKVSMAVAEEKKAEDKFIELNKKIIKLQEEQRYLSEEHAELFDKYIAGITGELAAELKDGECCPVCGSKDHPHKAQLLENNVTKTMVDEKKAQADQKYKELEKKLSEQETVKKEYEDKKTELSDAKSSILISKTTIENVSKSLVPGISSIKELDAEIVKLKAETEKYSSVKKNLEEKAGKAQQLLTEAKAKADSAKKEKEKAEDKRKQMYEILEKELKANGFNDINEAEKMLMTAEERNKLNKNISEYDAGVKSAEENLKSLKEELKGIEEPDETKCKASLQEISSANKQYYIDKTKLETETEKLEKIFETLKNKAEGLNEKIIDAAEDLVFAKRIKGDTGTSLQRYVLGIMFSSVVSAANKMLEKIHDGRYRLFRTDEKGQGSNKRGLELKVFDKLSEGHEGRFVSTLSGGEKFLVSLALSIGMSTIAQKSGIKIEALFIDEGFGSLDDESINDAMMVLEGIQKANGLVGIISHVQILQDQIPVKLRVEADADGSHITSALG